MLGSWPELVTYGLSPADAELLNLLDGFGLSLHSCASSAALRKALNSDFGCLLVAEEALTVDDARFIAALLNSQPGWSDLPVIAVSDAPIGALQSLAPSRNVTVMSRTVGVRAIASVVEVALRGRSQQFRCRDHIAGIRQQANEYRGIANCAPALVWMSDSAGGGVFFNQRWLEFTGRTLEHELGNGWIQAVHPDDQAALRLRAECFTRREPFTTEFRLRRHDGVYRWILDSGVPRFSETGEFLGFVGSCVDVTVQKEAERNMQELSEELAARVRDFESLLEAMPVGVAVADGKAGKTTRVNTTLAQMLGMGNGVREFESSQWQGGLPFRVYRNNQLLDVQDLPQEIAARTGEQVRSTELEIEKPNGNRSRLFGYATPLFNESGLVRGTIGAYIDVTDRYRAETALRESESRFRHMADHAPVMVWVTGPDGTCTYLSRSWYEFTGRPADSGLGQGWLEPVHPDDRSRCFDVFSLANGRREAFRVEYRLRRHDGEWRWALDAAAPRFAGDGTFLGFIGSLIDITERKRAEDLLRQSEDQLHTLADSMPQLAWMAHPDGHIFWFNRRWYDYTGTTPDHLESCWESAQDPAMLPRVLERWKATLVSGEPFEMEISIRGANGHFQWFLTRVVPVRDSDGRIARWFGTSTDIQELREAKEGLSDFNRRLELLASNANDMISLAEPEEYLGRIHARVVEYCGLEVCFNYWADRDPSRLQLAFCSGLTDEQCTDLQWLQSGEPVGALSAAARAPVIQENLARSDDEENAQLRALGLRAFCGFPLVAGERLLGVLAFATRRRDTLRPDEVELLRAITDQVATALDRVLLIRRLKIQNQHLARANRELEEFAYVASHDLQEPLRMVNIYSQLLLRTFGSVVDSNAAVYRGFVEEGVKRMENLIQDLLSFSRTVQSEAEAETPHPPADLNDSLKRALLALDVRIRESGAAIESAPLPRVRAETTHMTLVFQNLLSNSIKYAKPGEPPRVRIFAERQGADWVIRVSDSGIGFEQRHSKRIFGLFKRLHRQEYPGTGLGLAICRRIVERHGGRMWAEGEIGKGSTFSFSIPAVEE